MMQHSPASPDWPSGRRRSRRTLSIGLALLAAGLVGPTVTGQQMDPGLPNCSIFGFDMPIQFCQDLGPPQVPAFPGAEGAGATTVGGRGGTVVAVTNLEDSGPGSLRAAVNVRGPRTVVFRVGGVIELKRPIRIEEPYLTIAGQTAPGGGITLKGTEEGGGRMIVLEDVHDIVIRYLRIRAGAHGSPGQGQINIRLDAGAHDIVIDHVSLSWSLDENISIHRNIPDEVVDPTTWPEVYNITVQRSILSEGLWPHSTGIQTGGEADREGWKGVHDLTLHHNLFVTNSHRNPGLGSPSTQVINNVVYNWVARVGSTWRDISVDWIGNYFKRGPLAQDDDLIAHFDRNRATLELWPDASLHVDGNVAPGLDPLDNWSIYHIDETGDPLPDRFRRLTPLTMPGIPVTIEPAEDALASVIEDSGANARLACDGGWVPNADAIDQRVISDVVEGTGPSISPPELEIDVGGYVPIDPGVPCVDSDHDGMPDLWEQARGLAPLVDDSAGHTLDSEFTNLEMYLSGQ